MMKGFLFFLLSQIMVSEEALRFTNVYKQGYDTSCGIAVTASLLRHYWNIPIEEADLYQTMILDQAEDDAATYTISFLDIMNYVREHHLAAQAYKMDWAMLTDTLGKDFTPVIISYDKPQPHFALLVHIEKGFAFVADPAKGFEIVDQTTFEKNYSGNALLTASRNMVKDTERIQRITETEMERLATLQNLTHSRRRW
jgi:ABC-type bacteriocin/lantibiotic exporter with double-glycine peptidase domain